MLDKSRDFKLGPTPLPESYVEQQGSKPGFTSPFSASHPHGGRGVWGWDFPSHLVPKGAGSLVAVFSSCWQCAPPPLPHCRKRRNCWAWHSWLSKMEDSASFCSDGGCAERQGSNRVLQGRPYGGVNESEMSLTSLVLWSWLHPH